jgi:hypothetical protein
MLKKFVQTLADDKMGTRKRHSEGEHIRGSLIDDAKLDSSDRWFLFLENRLRKFHRLENHSHSVVRW